MYRLRRFPFRQRRLCVYVEKLLSVLFEEEEKNNKNEKKGQRKNKMKCLSMYSK